MEPVISSLIEQYKHYGYTLLKGGIFEDYDWYYQNRHYIDDGKILKVIQPNGKLLGIQADLTITALKNYVNRKDPLMASQKVFYYSNTYENVYGNDVEIKKHKVIGIEYFGSNDLLADAEVLQLAVKTLQAFGRPFIVEISYSDILKKIIDDLAGTALIRQQLLELISRRSFHELVERLRRLDVADDMIDLLLDISKIRGDLLSAIQQLKALRTLPWLTECIQNLQSLHRYLETIGLNDGIMVDLSLLNKQNYYCGLIFQGFAENIHKPMLHGGRYNALKTTGNRDFTSVGFTLELDDILIKNYAADRCDVMILYHQADPLILKLVQEFHDCGQSAHAVKITDIYDIKRLRQSSRQLLEFDPQTQTLKEFTV